MVNVIDCGPEREKEERQIQLLEKITEESKFFKKRMVSFDKVIENNQIYFNINIQRNNGLIRSMVASVHPSTSTVTFYTQEAFDEVKNLTESYQKALANSWTLVKDYKHPNLATCL